MNEYWDSLSNKAKAKFILTIIASVFALIFAMVNWKSVPVNLIFTTINVYLTILIIVCICIGYFISSLFEYKYYNRKVEEVNALKAEIASLQELAIKSNSTDVTTPETPK